MLSSFVCLQVAYCTAAVAFEDGRRPQFEVPYDVAVVAVGERPATFGVPGGQHGSVMMFGHEKRRSTA